MCIPKILKTMKYLQLFIICLISLTKSDPLDTINLQLNIPYEKPNVIHGSRGNEMSDYRISDYRASDYSNNGNNNEYGYVKSGYKHIGKYNRYNAKLYKYGKDKFKRYGSTKYGAKKYGRNRDGAKKYDRYRRYGAKATTTRTALRFPDAQEQVAASTPAIATTPAPTTTSGPSCYDVKNLQDLTAEERTNLVEGLRQLKLSGEFTNVSRIHGGPANVITSCGRLYCCPHGLNGKFLPWHRLFMVQINTALRRYNSEAVIPYWDWTSQRMPPLVTDPQIPDRNGNNVENPFLRGVVPHASSSVFNDTGRELYLNGSFTKRIPAPNAHNLTAYRISVLSALTKSDFRRFSAKLQTPHNVIHATVVSGSMATEEAAAYDPIFYLHHSMIDLVWAIHQLIYQAQRPLPPAAVMPHGLPPFSDSSFNTRTLITLENSLVRQTIDYRTNFCYHYNLNFTSPRIVFGGMSMSQIQSAMADYENCNLGLCAEFGARTLAESGYRYSKYGHQTRKIIVKGRIFAGFFLQNFGMSGMITFNICKRKSENEEKDCSFPGGQVHIFGGTYEMPYINEDPSTIDVTNAVIEAGVRNPDQVSFRTKSFEDIAGNIVYIQKDIFCPVRIFTPQKNKGTEQHTILFDKNCKQAPTMRIPTDAVVKAESPHKYVVALKKETYDKKCKKQGKWRRREYENGHFNKQDFYYFRTQTAINLDAKQYFLFEEDRQPLNCEDVIAFGKSTKTFIKID